MQHLIRVRVGLADQYLAVAGPTRPRERALKAERCAGSVGLRRAAALLAIAAALDRQIGASGKG
jgi:hypothetical protein